jgi:membrane protease YdiL (CAAX protease family)
MFIMNRLCFAARVQWEIVLHYPVTLALVAASACWTVYCGFPHNLSHSIGYLLAVWFCALVTDVIVYERTAPSLPIKRPLREEVTAILICTLLCAVSLAFHWSSRMQSIYGGGRLASILFLLLLGLPVVLGAIYFFYFHYTAAELGFRMNYWYLSPIVLMVFVATALLVAPSGLTWQSHRGIQPVAYAFLAAFSEEFVRMLMQTRFAVALRNPGVAFFLATFVWACLHLPVIHAQNRGMTWPEAYRGAPLIIPIGLLWGYMTYRTKSLIPAVMVHGLNYWGLQNFHG